METISLLAFIIVCLIYLIFIIMGAYYCSNYRKPFFWEKEKDREDSEKIHYNEI